jgi:hypothetical protein
MRCPKTRKKPPKKSLLRDREPKSVRKISILINISLKNLNRPCYLAGNKLMICKKITSIRIVVLYISNVPQPELGICYVLPFSLFANPLLQCSYSLSLLRYFSEICNTLFPIRYLLFATSFEQCNRLYISELFKFHAGLWIWIDFNLDPVPALDFWGF